MRTLDECHLQRPFYGSRRLRDWLEDLGFVISRQTVQRLMRTMGLTALYPKRNLSRRHQARKVYPYLLRGLVIDRPNQVAHQHGNGRWVDNVFVERLWRSLKYEEVYLKGYASVAEARTSISHYLDFFNQERRHQSLDPSGSCLIGQG